MAENTNIKGFVISGQPRYLDAKTIKGKDILENTLDALGAIYVNGSNNFEISAGAAGGEKLNLVGAQAIQIKPGVDEDGKAEAVQFDCEQHGTDATEMTFKICNGLQPKASRVVGLKINAAELTLDNQKCNTNEFDADAIDLKVRNDKWNSGEVVGTTGPVYLKVKARAIDLRCHDHGGIALQIAGYDGSGHENKIKFESDRTSEIGATPDYSKEGGKGLEFGTFNNEHTSLYTGDYRFKGDAEVYGATRKTPTQTSTGKIDYPTQGDDFKDVLTGAKHATWNEILDAANKCKDLESTVATEVARAAMSAGGIDVSGFVTRDNVEDMVASAMSEVHINTTGLATEQWVLDKGYINSLPDGIQYVKIGSSKGNFAIDVTGKYTWEQTGPKSATTVDEYGDSHAKGDRVINYENEAFYTNPGKVYYKAGMETNLADGETMVPEGTIVYTSACNLTFNVPDVADGGYEYYMMNDGETSYYENPSNFAYKCLAKKSNTFLDHEGIARGKNYYVAGAGLSESAVAYYQSKETVYDEDGVTVLVAGEWERVDIWKKSTLWSKNEINVNLETDSKIKFAGKKIETVWTYDNPVTGEEEDHKMAEILLSTESLAADANEVVFEQKISKNGDRSGQDTEFVYSFTNNVADSGTVANFEVFKANYNDKHKNHGKSNAELEAMYDAFCREGESFEISVKVSELLGLVKRVEELETKVARLEAYHPTPSEPEITSGTTE